MRIFFRTAGAVLFLTLAWAVVAGGFASAQQMDGPVHGGVIPPTPRPHSHPSKKKHHANPSPVTLTATVGFGGQFRTSSWTPVRAMVHNRSGEAHTVRVEINDGGTSNYGPSSNARTMYSTSVVLPPGATKNVSLYLPGYDIGGSLDVAVRENGQTLTTATPDATNFGDTYMTVGVLDSDPANGLWLRRIAYNSVDASVRLDQQTLDPYPQVLSAFDVIVISNFPTTQLTHDQISALQQYVRNGGALVLVGGPDWQETLKPLPAAWIPGQLTGTATVANLSGLRSLDPITMPKHGTATTLSVLRKPSGTVLASQSGVPLAVVNPLGRGQVLYLGFDPSVAPIPKWKGAGALLTKLISRASPTGVDRSALPSGYQQQQQFWGPWGPGNIGAELSNVPAAALPSLLLFIGLAILYVILLGPVNFLVLRRWGRREWAWITVPALAVVCVGSTFGMAYRLKGSTVLINSVGVLQLDGSDSQRPLTLYSGLFAPVRGDYTLTWNAPAFPTGVQQISYYRPFQSGSSNPTTLSFDAGARTNIHFLSMNMWSMRDVELQTTASVPGALTSDLSVDGRGFITGTIYNGTSLDLRNTAVLAGRTVAHLPDIPAGATIHTRIKPTNDLFDQSPLWMKLYGQPNYNGGQGYGFMGGGPKFFCHGCFGGGPMMPYQSGPPLPTENNFHDRIKNVAAMLPDIWTATYHSQMTLVGWTQQSLGSLSVDGSSPQRRDLTLVTVPLSVHLSRGHFRLRAGTLGARLVDISPQQSTNGCCNAPPGSLPSIIGYGGSGVFEFDVPHSGRVHFHSLVVGVNAGGADGTDIGHVYNWRTGQWTRINLHSGYSTLNNPNSFVSPDGKLLLSLKATGDSVDTIPYGTQDITIGDLHQDLQISGSGTVT